MIAWHLGAEYQRRDGFLVLVEAYRQDDARRQEVKRRQEQAEPVRMPKAVKPPSPRDEQIYSVIEKGLKGRRYAARVHAEGMRTPKRWRERACPYTYPEAYAIGKPWRDEIYREKYDIKKRVEASKNLPRFS